MVTGEARGCTPCKTGEPRPSSGMSLRGVVVAAQQFRASQPWLPQTTAQLDVIGRGTGWHQRQGTRLKLSRIRGTCSAVSSRVAKDCAVEEQGQEVPVGRQRVVSIMAHGYEP